MFEHWARHTHGMMGRSPDYMNTVLMSFASSAALLKDRDHCFPEHVQALYERAAAQDLSFTHVYHPSGESFTNGCKRIADTYLGKSRR